MKIGRTWGSRRIRQQVGQPRYVLRREARFTPSLGLADWTIVTPSRPRLRRLCRFRDRLSFSHQNDGRSFRRGPSAWFRSNIGKSNESVDSNIRRNKTLTKARGFDEPQARTSLTIVPRGYRPKRTVKLITEV